MGFDDLVLDLGTRELTRNGVPIELGRLSYSLLAALVEAAPNVVDHGRIADRVWNGRMTSPETITQRVKLLRDALGDDAEHPRYIGLVRGHGYRLLPPCRVLDAPAAAAGGGGRVAGGGRARRRALLVIPVVVALALAAWFVLSLPGNGWRDEATHRTPQRPGTAQGTQLPASIAVLPFRNLSADPGDAYFAAGFHDTLLSELATISGLRVIARSSVLQYADGSVSHSRLAEELQVGAILDGSLQFDGELVRVNVALVDAGNDTQLWAQRYDRPLDDIFAIQTEIAIAISDVLQARLLPSERRAIETSPTHSAAAYALYLEARVDTDRRRLPLEDDRGRLPLLDRALALDPAFAHARVERAMIYTWAVAYSEAGSSADEVARRHEYERLALEDAALAIEADPTLPGPWLVRGILDLESWRWPEAEASFRKALELSPRDPDALLQYAYFLTYSGAFDEALELARRRLDIDPYSVASNNGLGFIAIAAHQPQVAIERYAHVARLAPGVWFFHVMAAHAYLQAGDRQRAEQSLRTAEALRGEEDLGVFLANCAAIYRRLDLHGDAQRAFGGFRAWTARNVVGEGDWATAYLGIGEQEGAYGALQRAIAKIESGTPDSHQALILLAMNVTGDPLLEEPRLRELRARLVPAGVVPGLKPTTH